MPTNENQESVWLMSKRPVQGTLNFGSACCYERQKLSMYYRRLVAVMQASPVNSINLCFKVGLQE